MAKPRDGLAHARGATARRGGTAKQTAGATSRVLDQSLMDLCHRRVNTRDQRELFARREKGSHLDEQAFRVSPARGWGLGKGLHCVLAQCEQRARRSGGIPLVRDESGAKCSVQVSAQVVHVGSFREFVMTRARYRMRSLAEIDADAGDIKHQQSFPRTGRDKRPPKRMGSDAGLVIHECLAFRRRRGSQRHVLSCCRTSPDPPAANELTNRAAPASSPIGTSPGRAEASTEMSGRGSAPDCGAQSDDRPGRCGEGVRSPRSASCRSWRSRHRSRGGTREAPAG